MTSRRSFLRSAGLQSAGLLAAAAVPIGTRADSGTASLPRTPLQEFGYGDVDLAPGQAQTQFEQTQAVLLGLNEDSLLKPWRLRAGLPSPGPELGGWYDELPLEKTESGGHGFAPAHCFGQWLSALARGYAVTHDAATRKHLDRLLSLYAPTISGRFYKNFRFPAYNFDKMVIGLTDAHEFAQIPNAFDLLDRTTDAAVPHLPPHALDRDEPQRQWRKSVGDSTADDYTWDESYTLPENLFLAAKRGAGSRYETLAGRYLLDKTYFDPLADGKDALAHHHAYSFCNALNSAMQAYLTAGSEKHLRAASNAFQRIVATQSFASGGWGPNESFGAEGSDALYESLTGTHRGFETPCGSYAHFKLTRYLLRVTGDGRYGDSMERVFYNTVLGAKRLESDGHAFYYSDYHSPGRKAYFPDAWPCCSGTLPQVAADYRLLPYLRDERGILINLYLPSTLRAVSPDGSQFSLTQTGSYPLGADVAIRLRMARSTNFAMRLRIPAWVSNGPAPTLRLNGAPVTANSSEKGFVTLERRWTDGDSLDLRMPMRLRLEAISAKHPSTVALLRGPLVLFGIGDLPSRIDRGALLAAERRSDEHAWSVNTRSGPITLRPFAEIGDESYRTYFDVV